MTNGVDPDEINNKYKVASDEINIKYKNLKKKWIKGVYLNPEIEKSKTFEIWHVEEINKIVNKFGAEKFQVLNIWKHDFVKNIIIQ